MKQLNLFNKNSTYKISTWISTIYKIIPIGEKCRKNNSKKKKEGGSTEKVELIFVAFFLKKKCFINL